MISLKGEMPADFHDYWFDVLKQLAKVPAAPEVEVLPIRSTGFATMYGVHFTSLGSYRLFAYLSVPRGRGPFPAIYHLPRYGSVVEPIPQGAANAKRRRYVTFSMAFRGQRHADQPFAASFPGLLTEGIDGPASYVFREIVADCYRGAEYLLGRPEVDPSRVVAIGNDLSLITASLHPGITHVLCTPALFYATCDLAPRTSEYPLEEINDYMRYSPSNSDRVRRTLAYFDLRWFSPAVKAITLLISEARGGLVDRPTLESLIQALYGKAEVYESQRSTYKDGLFVERWLTRQFGFRRAIVPEHWR